MPPARCTRNVLVLVPSGSRVPVNVSGIVAGAGVGVAGGTGSWHPDAISATPSATGTIHFIVFNDTRYCTVRMTLPKCESVPTVPLTPMVELPAGVPPGVDGGARARPGRA